MKQIIYNHQNLNKNNKKNHLDQQQVRKEDNMKNFKLNNKKKKNK